MTASPTELFASPTFANTSAGLWDAIVGQLTGAATLQPVAPQPGMFDFVVPDPGPGLPVLQ